MSARRVVVSHVQQDCQMLARLAAQLGPEDRAGLCQLAAHLVAQSLQKRIAPSVDTVPATAVSPARSTRRSSAWVRARRAGGWLAGLAPIAAPCLSAVL